MKTLAWPIVLLTALFWAQTTLWGDGLSLDGVEGDQYGIESESLSEGSSTGWRDDAGFPSLLTRRAFNAVPASTIPPVEFPVTADFVPPEDSDAFRFGPLELEADALGMSSPFAWEMPKETSLLGGLWYEGVQATEPVGFGAEAGSRPMVSVAMPRPGDFLAIVATGLLALVIFAHLRRLQQWRQY